MALEPITRKEKIIAGENLEPITRMEQFLKKFGGSGGSGGGGGVFRVNLTPTNESSQYSADKTFAEIVAAHKGGMEVEAVTVESEEGLEIIAIYQLSCIDVLDNLIFFTGVGAVMGSFYIYVATMGADGVVTITEKKVP